jgi:REP element-mobilizing transposase RayT
MQPEISVNKMLQTIREEFPELKEFCGLKAFWADCYLLETSGQVNEESIREYIRNQ